MNTILVLLFSLICIGYTYWIARRFGTRRTYVHLKTGNLYTLLYKGKMKNPDISEWIPSVTYRSHKDGRVYTRAYMSFHESFKRVDEYDKMDQL